MPTLSDTQLDWLSELLGIDKATIASGSGINVPIGQAGAAMSVIGDGGNDAPSPAPQAGGGKRGGGKGGGGKPAGGGAQPGDIEFQRTGPMVRVPMNADGTPIRGMEINAGAVDTDVGLPPDPITGDYVDPSLIDLRRTDLQRTGDGFLNANEPIPPEMQGQYDFVLGNNPKGYVPDLENVADLVRPGGRIIMQGRTRANGDFTEMLNRAAPQGQPPTPPEGTSLVPEMLDVNGNPMPFRPGGVHVNEGQTVPEAIARGQQLGGEASPADIMGGGFRRTEGGPTHQGPNARLILEKNQPQPVEKAPPIEEPPAAKAPVAETPVAETPVAETPIAETPVAETPVSKPSTPTTKVGGSEEAAAGAESGMGSAVKGGLLGAGIAAGIQVAQDWDKVKSGQMSVGDAAVDVGSKAAEVGGLTFGGTAVADAVVGGSGAEAAAVTAGADALAGAAGGEAGAVAGVATSMASVASKGGVIGGVVAGGMALIDDVGKVRSGEMTAGAATVDVAAKTAVGVGAGMAGAAAGAEIGAIVGTAIPIPVVGTAVGFVAGAVVGGAVGYVGSKIMDTEIGKEVIHGAGKAVDAAIDGVETAGKFVAKEAGEAVDKVEEVAAGAAHAVADGAGKAVDAVENAASSAWDKVTSLF